jgi:hypothetical protein
MVLTVIVTIIVTMIVLIMLLLLHSQYSRRKRVNLCHSIRSYGNGNARPQP